MKKLDYYVDTREYELCILGTGLTESLFAASLSKIDRSKVLVIDTDSGYGSAQKTLNLKELRSEAAKHLKVNKDKNISAGSLKSSFFETIELSEERQSSNEQLMVQLVEESSLFKSFNIDLQPKLLFSTSLAVDCMQQARMDSYMDFRAIEASYVFCEKTQKFTETACSKSDIFKSSVFSLLEKKQLFQFLHRCMALQNQIIGRKADPNSLAEFDKEFNLDEDISEELLNSPCTEFLAKHISSKWVQDVLFFGICAFEQDPRKKILDLLKKDYTTRGFLSRLFKYISSCGQHSPLPFLYTNYGTGDVPQGYVRVGAIFGAAYCLHSDICIQRIDVDQNNNCFLIRSNLTPQPDEIDEQKKNEDKNKDKCGVTDKKQEENSTNNSSIQETVSDQKEVSGEEQKLVGQQEDQTSKTAISDHTSIPNDSTTNEQQQQVPEQEQKQELSSVKKEETFVKAQKLLVGSEFQNKIKDLLGIEKNQPKEEVKLLRVTVISKKSEEQQACELEEENQEEEIKRKKQYKCVAPLLYQIPPTDGPEGFSQPVLILQLDNHSSTTPKGYQVFHCKKVLEPTENGKEETDKIVKFIETMHLKLPMKVPFQFTADYVWAYEQIRQDTGEFQLHNLKKQSEEKVNSSDDNNKGQKLDESKESDNKKDLLVGMVGQDGFELDLDRNFEEYRENISQLSNKVNTKDENYFQTIEEMNGKVDFYQNELNENQDDEENGSMSGFVQNVLSKFENLKSKDEKIITEKEESTTENGQKQLENTNPQEIPQSSEASNEIGQENKQTEEPIEKGVAVDQQKEGEEVKVSKVGEDNN